MRVLSKEPMLIAKAEQIEICPCCAFVIAFLEKDVKKHDFDDYVQKSVICGNCNEKIII